MRDLHGQLDSILHLRDQVNTGAVRGPRIYSAGAMIDGLPTTYPDATRRQQPARRPQGGGPPGQRGRGSDQGLHPGGPDACSRRCSTRRSTFNLRVAGASRPGGRASPPPRTASARIEHLSGVPEAALADASSLNAAHYRGFFAGWTAFERSWAGLDSARTRPGGQGRWRNSGTIMVPTLVLHETFSRLDDPAVLQRHDAPRRARVAAAAVERARHGPAGGMDHGGLSAFRAARPRQDQFLRLFAAAGGRIATGTDASNQLLIPGYSEHRELELLVGAGLRPATPCSPATRNGALVLGVDSLGLIAPGQGG